MALGNRYTSLRTQEKGGCCHKQYHISLHPFPLHTSSATQVSVRGGGSVGASRVIKRCHGVRGKRMPANFTAPDPNKSCRGVTWAGVGQVREVYGAPVTLPGGLGQVRVSRHPGPVPLNNVQALPSIDVWSGSYIKLMLNILRARL